MAGVRIVPALPRVEIGDMIPRQARKGIKDMRIEVSGKHLELTPAIQQYADAKCQKLPRYYDGVQEIFVTLEKHAKHEEYQVEIRADVEKHEDFVVKVVAGDLYEGIDLAVDKMERQLTDFKEKLKNSKR